MINEKNIAVCNYCGVPFLLNQRQIRHYESGKSVYCNNEDTYYKNKDILIYGKTKCQNKDKCKRSYRKKILKRLEKK